MSVTVTGTWKGRWDGDGDGSLAMPKFVKLLTLKAKPQQQQTYSCGLATGKQSLCCLCQRASKRNAICQVCFVPMEVCYFQLHLHPGGATTTGPDATPPPSYLPKLAGWGVGWGGGIGSSAGGGGGCARPTTTTCIPQGGVCVWGHGGIEV